MFCPKYLFLLLLLLLFQKVKAENLATSENQRHEQKIYNLRKLIVSDPENARELINKAILFYTQTKNTHILKDYQLLKIDLNLTTKDYGRMKIDLINLLKNENTHTPIKQRLLTNYYVLMNNILNLDTNDIQHKINKLLYRAKKINFNYLEGKCLYLKGYQFEDAEHYEKSIKYHELAVQKFATINDSHQVIKNKFSLANIYFYTNEYQKSKKLYSDYTSYCEKHKLDKMVCYGYSALGDLYFELKNYQRAKTYFQRTLQVNSNFKNGTILNAMQYLGHIYQLINQLDSSNYYFDRYIKLSNETVVKSNLKVAEEYEKIYENDIQQIKIQQKTQEIKHIKKTKNLIIIFSIVTIILLILIFFFVLKAYCVKKGMNVILKSQKNNLIAQRMQIDQSLKEKTILLKEIHHRVKNNLQIVSSLLNMQSRNTEDPNALNVLEEAKERILAISLIHQKLYQSENLGAVDMSSYVQELVTQLNNTYTEKDKEVTFDIHIEDNLPINLDTAVPIGLIICELITNSIKHAFKNKKSGKVNVHLSPNTQTKNFLLEVQDDGGGFDTKTKKSGLGTEIIEALTEQLSGILTISSSKKGSRFQLQFNEI